jgi:hypothetical protein
VKSVDGVGSTTIAEVRRKMKPRVGLSGHRSIVSAKHETESSKSTRPASGRV